MGESLADAHWSALTAPVGSVLVYTNGRHLLGFIRTRRGLVWEACLPPADIATHGKRVNLVIDGQMLGVYPSGEAAQKAVEERLNQ